MPLVDDDVGLTRILVASRRIAVVGLSANAQRPSHGVARYMLDRGYTILPVNPAYAEVLGQPCFPDLASTPGAVDMVDCFRRAEEIEAIARAAVTRGARVLWMQLGIRNEVAAGIALAAGLDVVMDRCLKIEHARLLGGLNLAGGTGVSPVRGPD